MYTSKLQKGRPCGHHKPKAEKANFYCTHVSTPARGIRPAESHTFRSSPSCTRISRTAPSPHTPQPAMPLVKVNQWTAMDGQNQPKGEPVDVEVHYETFGDESGAGLATLRASPPALLPALGIWADSPTPPQPRLCCWSTAWPCRWSSSARSSARRSRRPARTGSSLTTPATAACRRSWTRPARVRDPHNMDDHQNRWP